LHSFQAAAPKTTQCFSKTNFVALQRSVRSAEQTLVCASFSFFHFSSSSLKMFFTEKSYLFHFLNNFLTSDETLKFFKKSEIQLSSPKNREKFRIFS
jgi:hypothetical protein